MDTSDEWITTRTGIKFRHIADDSEKTSDLAAESARRALADADLQADDIDLIIVATATPDMQFPSTATIVQQKLGIANGCPAFDVQAVCAGFMYAMTTANAYIKSGMAKNALVIGAETFSRIVDWNDRTTCVLFGDGAGAVVLSASDEPGIIHSKSQSRRQLPQPFERPGTNCQRPDLRFALHQHGRPRRIQVCRQNAVQNRR